MNNVLKKGAYQNYFNRSKMDRNTRYKICITLWEGLLDFGIELANFGPDANAWAMERLALGVSVLHDDSWDRHLLSGLPGESNVGTWPRLRLPSSITNKPKRNNSGHWMNISSDLEGIQNKPNDTYKYVYCKSIKQSMWKRNKIMRNLHQTKAPSILNGPKFVRFSWSSMVKTREVKRGHDPFSEYSAFTFWNGTTVEIYICIKRYAN